MYKTFFCALSFLLLSNSSIAQKKATPIDSTEYYNDLFNELDNFLDSLTAPRTFFIVNATVANNYFNFTNTSSTLMAVDRKMSLTPSLGYYHKSGLGLSASTVIANDGDKWNAFQYLISGSYDYLKNKDFFTGASLTHYFTKDSLSFYTSPLENEASVYFTYKKAWVKPSITAIYGWGSKTAYEQQEKMIKLLRKRTNAGYTVVETVEKVNDFTVSASVRHDFYWLDKLGPRTSLRFTPLLVFTSGTQRFGFNQTSNSYLLPQKSSNNILYNTENVQLDSRHGFQPLSVTAFLKSEASWDKFYVQPQIGFDYYLPAKQNNFTTAFAVSVGATF